MSGLGSWVESSGLTAGGTQGKEQVWGGVTSEAEVPYGRVESIGPGSHGRRAGERATKTITWLQTNAEDGVDEVTQGGWEN